MKNVADRRSALRARRTPVRRFGSGCAAL